MKKGHGNDGSGIPVAILQKDLKSPGHMHNNWFAYFVFFGPDVQSSSFYYFYCGDGDLMQQNLHSG